MEKSLMLLCSIFPLSLVVSGRTQGEPPVSSAVLSSGPKNFSVVLTRKEISEEVVLHKATAVDGEIVSIDELVRRIEAEHSQSSSPGGYDTTFHLTEEDKKQLTVDSSEIIKEE